MTTAQKFAFTTSFDDMDKLAPGETVFTKAAEEKGYAQGYAEGHEKGLQEGRTDALSALQNMSNNLIALHEQAHEELHREVVKTSYLMMKNLFPKYAETVGEREILSIVEEGLKEREGDKLIQVIVAESVEKPLQELVARLKEENPQSGEIVIKADPSFQPMDCQIRWDNGGAEVLVSRILEEMKEAASRIVPLEELEAAIETTEESPPEAAPQEETPTEETTEEKGEAS